MIFKKIIILSLALLFSQPLFVYAGALDVPKTGQTTKYYDGDDGDLKKGAAWPVSRFAVSGECVTDNLTGLMWSKDGNLPGGQVTWPGALNYVTNTVNSGTGLCGYTDWRLPNAREMESLLNVGEANSATWLNGQGFENVQSGGVTVIGAYWSSTTGAQYTNRAESVYVGGSVGSFTFKTDKLYMWPVRTSGNAGAVQLPKTGQTYMYSVRDDGDLEIGVVWPDPRFTVNGDCVVDNLTGLVWTKDANLMMTRNPEFDNDGVSGNGAVTWWHALDYMALLNTTGYCGYSDWRLPNRRELWSLVDYSKKSPSLPASHPFTNVMISYYWSSTTADSYYPPYDYAWNLNSAYGFLEASNKTWDMYVWPVRGGVAEPLSVSMHANPSSPQIPGTSIAVTAAAAGGTGSYEYQFKLRNPAGVWSVGRAYSSTPAWTWNTTGLAAGAYKIEVLARNAGSTASWEAYKNMSYTLAGPVSAVTLTANAASPQSVGNKITFTAAASGGSGNYEYQYKVKNPAGVWSTGRSYAAAPSWTWNTTGLAAGAYKIEVWARNTGSTAAWEAYKNMSYTLRAPVASVSLSANKTSPQARGTAITFTASATGTSGSYVYQYKLRTPSGVWSVARNYSSTPTWTWSTTAGQAAGTYKIEVWAKNAGSNASWEAYRNMNFTLQ